MSTPKPRENPPPTEDATAIVVRRHLIFGWIAILVFVLLGTVLEALHGFKVGSYLNPSQSTRRLLWTLAHSHGTLLGLLNLGFAFTLTRTKPADRRTTALASGLLRAATVLLPGGFFLGGLRFYEGDPGPGVVLVPFGALALIAATWFVVRSVGSKP